ncbi:MAG: oxaloacetate decarboxylase [Candidatus Njordarchaeota archaeon]
MLSVTKTLRKMLEEPGLIIRPGVYDALSAKIAEMAGFKVLLMTGYGVSAVKIGEPDVGLISFGEMIQRAQEICHAVKVPVIVDADTGYGNAINVYRTTREVILAGAAGIQIEDQVWPKRCGHMFGKQIISAEEMVGKIRAAVDARNEIDPNFVIGARTDARTVAGFEEVLRRAKMYADAGADYIYVETPQSLEEVKKLVKEVPIPIAFNMIEGGKTPYFTFEELEKAGVKMISLPLTLLYAATKVMIEVLELVKKSQTPKEWEHMCIDWRKFNELIGLPRFKEMEKKYIPEEILKKKYGSIEKMKEQ